MRTKVVGKPVGKIDVKRLYLPGVEISSTCPMCGSSVSIDLEYHWLIKPEFNGHSFVNMCHTDCPVGNGTTTWIESFRLQVELKII